MSFPSLFGMKKGYSCTDTPSTLPLQPQTLYQSANFDPSFKTIEMEFLGGGNKKKDRYGDRFIPSGIRSNAYDMKENNCSKKEPNLMKKTSVEFYQEYLCSHIMN